MKFGCAVAASRWHFWDFVTTILVLSHLFIFFRAHRVCHFGGLCRCVDNYVDSNAQRAILAIRGTGSQDFREEIRTN